MLSSFRRQVKRVPVLGDLIYRSYMRWRYGDGQVLSIDSGPLKGSRLRRFVRTYIPEQQRGDYEWYVQNALIAELKSGDTFFDVGANGGFFSLLGAKLVGPSGKVVGFEPHPETARQARAQLRVNDCRNATIVQAAISDRSGMLHFSDGSNGFNRHLIDGQPSQQSQPAIRVQSITLDEAAQQYGPPDVIKIDIEGAEVLALRGATEILRQHRPSIVLEIHNAALAQQVYEMLERVEYSFYRIGGEPIEERVYHAHVIARGREFAPPRVTDQVRRQYIAR